ncbi:transcriptional repressor NrdR, partial [Candidatus Pacearchaeota archaeon CG10_big_fil_rev_8_21_14_0_10_30_48]
KSEPLERYVVKKDGRRERFDRDKIFLGIIKSCEKRNISHEQVDQIVQEIENKMVAYKKEVPTEKIGEQIMKKLKRIDKIAYIRFASVYRDFHDVEDFKKEMSGL